MKAADIFIDIGHGIGSVVMQAAFTRGCESRGIELMEPRHLVATQFNHNLQQQKAIKKQQNINNIDVSKRLRDCMTSFLFNDFCNNYTTFNVYPHSAIKLVRSN